MNIQKKFFLILFCFSLTLVLLSVLLMQWSINKGMVEYVNTKEVERLAPVINELAAEYEKNYNWQGMDKKRDKLRHIISSHLSDSEFPNRPNSLTLPYKSLSMPPPLHPPLELFISKRNLLLGNNLHLPPPPHGDKVHYALLDSDEAFITGKVLDGVEYSKSKIRVNDKVVGFLAISKRNQLTQGYELDFIEQQQVYLWFIGVLLMSLVALVALPLARHVVEPIKLITRGVHKLTQGDYQQPIHLKRQDELGALSRDYNELAVTLSENETARKRWLANISHELRTPIVILSGELEAMLDDIRPLTKNNIASAYDELQQLKRLVEDLQQLTCADIGGMNYRKQHENLAKLLKNEMDKYHSYLSAAGMILNLDITDEHIAVYADKTRLYQLFENIITNAIKYSNGTELNILLRVEKKSEQAIAVITFEDNGTGIEDTHLNNLFEYLYRVENSRNRKTGGSGLGLSICRHIVLAHQGNITAEHACSGGLAIVIKLPIARSFSD
ncbi:ATP-binding protein [Colwelliaceae bacterium 6471]